IFRARGRAWNGVYVWIDSGELDPFEGKNPDRTTEGRIVSHLRSISYAIDSAGRSRRPARPDRSGDRMKRRDFLRQTALAAGFALSAREAKALTFDARAAKASDGPLEPKG